MAGPEQVRRHAGAHVPEPDESDVHDGSQFRPDGLAARAPHPARDGGLELTGTRRVLTFGPTTAFPTRLPARPSGTIEEPIKKISVLRAWGARPSCVRRSAPRPRG